MKEIVVIFIVSLILSALIGFLATYALICRHRWKKSLEIRNKNLPVDLELATSEQLFKELRSRGLRYLMLRPTNDAEAETSGLSIEISGIAPADAAMILMMATTLTAKEFQRRGLPFPGQETDDE